MRVECKTFDGLLANLRAIEAKQLVEGILRVSISEREESEVKFFVNFQVSALIHFASYEGQYLLEFGEDVGRDIRDSEPESPGTEKARKYRTELEKLCKFRGWTILPGIISI